MHLHIEFMGTPGSGKTTLTQWVSRILGERGICVRMLDEAARLAYRRSLRKNYLRWIHDLYALNAARRFLPDGFRGEHSFLQKYVTANPALMAFLFDSYRQRQFRRDDIERDVKFMFQLCAKYQMCGDHLNESESLIIDEGFVYQPIRVLSSGDRAFEREYLERYLEITTKPRVVFRLRADYERCYRRIHERRGGPPPKLGKREKGDAIRFLELCDSNMNTIASLLPGYGVKVIDIDTNTDIEKNQAVHGQIHELADQMF